MSKLSTTEIRVSSPASFHLLRGMLTGSLLVTVAWLGGCRDAPQQQTAAPDVAPSVVEPEASASAALPGVAQDPWPSRLAEPLMDDPALGALINALSEQTGDFPSDNFVSNETSYLHVASSLGQESIRGRGYVGVGPEQNLTYAALMNAQVAYIIDIRRQNMLEHMVLRAAMEDTPDRARFFASLTSRPYGCFSAAMPATLSVDELASDIAKEKASPELRQALTQRTLALMHRLGVATQPADAKGVRAVVSAFADRGLELTYSMEGSNRPYPSLRQLLSSSDDEGLQRSFVSSEKVYAQVRSMMVANRFVPVVGDFAGDRALLGIAQDLRARDLQLGVFYTSNVEQYLFQGGVYGKFVRNVKALPTDDASILLRVWFDQGRAHPKQRAGHRTTSLVMPAKAFLDGHETKPYRSYWQVVTN